MKAYTAEMMNLDTDAKVLLGVFSTFEKAAAVFVDAVEAPADGWEQHRGAFGEVWHQDSEITSKAFLGAPPFTTRYRFLVKKWKVDA